MSHEQTISFGPIDWLIIGAYLLMLVSVGLYHARRQTGIKEYFLAGKHMSWLPIGLSLMAALNSGIDYLMVPSAFLKFGAVILVVNLSWLLLYPYAFFVTMPFYRRLDVYSAYEYLENRFNVAVRCLAAVIFIMWRLGWMATALYVPCLAFHTATGGQLPLKPTIMVMGAVATLYTMLGGVKAVIWTEVIQFLVMFGGLAMTLVIIFINVPVDFAAVWSTLNEGASVATAGSAHAPGFLTQVVELFREPVTWYGLLIATVVGRLTGYTSDQVMVQRFQTSRTIRDIRQGFIVTAVSDVAWMVTLAFVGVALHLFFRGQKLPAWVVNTDYYFPYLMARIFPAGTTGPIIAAILAASLSAIASAINSQSTVVMVDFYNRLWKGRRRPPEYLTEQEERIQMLLSRLAVIAAGVLGTALACQLDRLGTLFEIANKVIQTFTGPVLAIFWLGMFTKRATSTSAFLGGIVGTLVGVYVAFLSSLSFLWPAVFAFVSALASGYGVGLLSPVSENARRWNWFAVTRSRLTE